MAPIAMTRKMEQVARVSSAPPVGFAGRGSAAAASGRKRAEQEMWNRFRFGFFMKTLLNFMLAERQSPAVFSCR
jgi:hypothetical protein